MKNMDKSGGGGDGGDSKSGGNKGGGGSGAGGSHDPAALLDAASLFGKYRNYFLLNYKK